MDPQFSSGEPSRLSRWLRTYRIPVAMTAAFFVALAAFAVAPSPNPVVDDQADVPTRTAGPADSSPCIACELGKVCDASGECVFADATPFPCEPGTTFDEDEGFCLPDETPEPTAPPTKTLNPRATPRSTPRSTPHETPGQQTPRPTPRPTPQPTEEPSTPRPPSTPDAGD